MIKLQSKPNTNAPSPAFPYGDLRDNPGDNTGTPVNRELLSDIIQTVEKIVDESGITPNGLLDNASNGWQLFDAMRKVFYPYKEYVGNFSADGTTLTTLGIFRNDFTAVNVNLNIVGSIIVVIPELIGKDIYTDFDLSIEMYYPTFQPNAISAGEIVWDDTTGTLSISKRKGDTSLVSKADFRIQIREKL